MGGLPEIDKGNLKEGSQRSQRCCQAGGLQFIHHHLLVVSLVQAQANGGVDGDAAQHSEIPQQKQ